LTISVPPSGSLRIYFGTLIAAQSKPIGLTARGGYPVRVSLAKGAEHDHHMSRHHYIDLELEDAANQAR